MADPRVSPDGKSVAFTIGDVNLDGNRVVNQIYVVSLAGGATQTVDQLVISPLRLPAGRQMEKR